ncbi:hypothetical protein PQR15_22125 [Streptomyces lydicus]|nr:hypothetical protein [Streptomyces lydicus]
MATGTRRARRAGRRTRRRPAPRLVGHGPDGPAVAALLPAGPHHHLHLDLDPDGRRHPSAPTSAAPSSPPAPAAPPSPPTSPCPAAPPMPACT